MTNPRQDKWKIMVIDEDVEFHERMHSLLDGFVFGKQSLIWLSAYSLTEAKHLLQVNPDTVVIFLVASEQQRKRTRYFLNFVRKRLNNHLIRLVLMTTDSELDVSIIIEDEINDYQRKQDIQKENLELTIARMLKSYMELRQKEPIESVNVQPQNRRDKYDYQELRLRDHLEELYKTEQVILEKQKCLEDIVYNISDGILIVDQQGFILFANPASERLFNKPATDLIYSHLGIPLVSKQTAEIEFITAPANISVGEMSMAMTEWGGESVYLVSLRDITERKQAEKALRESEEKFRQLAENIPEIFWIISTETRELIYISPACEKIWGWSPMTLYTKPSLWTSAIYVEDRQSYMAILLKQRRGESTSTEYRILRPDGQIRWIYEQAFPVKNERGNVYRVVGIAEDITERKLTEQKLRQNQERLLEAQRVARIGNWEYDLKTKKLSWTQEVFCLFNRDQSQGEPTYEEYLDLYHPDSQKQLHQAIEQTIATGEHHKLLLQRHEPLPDGSICYIECIGQVEFNQQREAIRLYGTAQDITERVRTEQALRESELQFRAVFTQMFQFIGLLSPDGIILEINQSFLGFLGLERSLVVNQPFWALPCWQTPELLAQLQGALEGAARGEFVRYEVGLQGQQGQMLTVDFSLRPVQDEQGNVVFIIPEGRDISNLKEAQASIRESERRWRSLLENVQLIVVELDREGKVEYINPFFEKVTGFTAEEVIGKPWFTTFVPYKSQPTVQCAFTELLAQGFHPHFQNPVLTKSGGERMIAWNNTILHDLAGEPIGTISIGEDITERAKLERMKAEFVSVVSHELRTPLTSMQAALSLLQEKIIDPNSEKGEATIRIATDAVDRLVRLVNDILDLERLESGKIRLQKSLCDVSRLINEATTQMEEMANQAGITLDVTSESLQVYADPDRLIQVLTNLVSNGIKFSPSGGTVWITAELIPQQREETAHTAPLMALRAKKGQPEARSSPPNIETDANFAIVLFSVKDQGRGIPPNSLESIFERFQQVDASDSRLKGGTGLGLAICRNIVEQHGGIIWAESVLGEGSTFYFTIPMLEGVR